MCLMLLLPQEALQEESELFGGGGFALMIIMAFTVGMAVIGSTLHGKTVSKAKWLALIPVIGTHT